MAVFRRSFSSSARGFIFAIDPSDVTDPGERAVALRFFQELPLGDKAIVSVEEPMVVRRRLESAGVSATGVSIVRASPADNTGALHDGAFLNAAGLIRRDLSDCAVLVTSPEAASAAKRVANDLAAARRHAPRAAGVIVMVSNIDVAQVPFVDVLVRTFASVDHRRDRMGIQMTNALLGEQSDVWLGLSENVRASFLADADPPRPGPSRSMSNGRTDTRTRIIRNAVVLDASTETDLYSAVRLEARNHRNVVVLAHTPEETNLASALGVPVVGIGPGGGTGLLRRADYVVRASDLERTLDGVVLRNPAFGVFGPVARFAAELGLPSGAGALPDR